MHVVKVLPLVNKIKPHKPLAAITLKLNISFFIKSLFIIMIILSAASIILKTELTGHKYIVSLFDLDKEMNVPTFFESIMLFISSVLFFIVFQGKKNNRQRYAINWFILSLIFLILSADEFMALHEQTTQFFKESAVGNYIHFAWLIPASVFLIFFLISYSRFFFNLTIKYRKLFFFSAALFVWGSMGMEMAGGIYQNNYGQHNTVYYFLTNFEETFEMSGVILLIYSLLNYIKDMKIISEES